MGVEKKVLLPDIGDSLDGHLTEQETSPVTVGGTPVGDIASMGESIATLVLGNSMFDAADFLAGAAGPWDIVFVDPPFGREFGAERLKSSRCGECARCCGSAVSAPAFLNRISPGDL